jgi:hypothetical protein
MTKPEFHYRHSTNPKEITELLSIVGSQGTPQNSGTISAIKENARILGFDLGGKDEATIERYPIWFASRLDLVSDDMKLSGLGKAISESQSSILVFDFLHFLSYSKWNVNSPSENCFSWTYRRLCELLWDAGTCLLDYHALAAALTDRASTEFPEDYRIDVAKISLGARSIEGAVKWLSALHPQVIYEDGRDKRFQRRGFCPPELMLLAVGLLYRDLGIEFGSSILLDSNNTTRINCVCLLDPLAFEKVLPWVIRQYSDLIEEIPGSGWGRQLRLKRQISVESLLR